jgi:hypothetical protein
MRNEDLKKQQKADKMLLADKNKSVATKSEFEKKIQNICHAINPNYPKLREKSDWLQTKNHKIYPIVMMMR